MTRVDHDEAPAAVTGTAEPAAETAAPDAAPAPAVGERRQRQVRILLAAVVGAALLALFWPQGPGRKAAPGGFLVDASGQPASLDPKMAPVTLVHFWATWCAPCVDEIPTLQRLANDYAARDAFRLNMIAVDDTHDKVVDFLGAGEAAAVLYDPEWDVANKFGTRQLPETYLIVDGRIAEKYVGAQDWGDARLRARIDAALQEIAAATGG